MNRKKENEPEAKWYGRERQASGRRSMPDVKSGLGFLAELWIHLVMPLLSGAKLRLR